jgi:small-conductance mechanosensitive channel
MQDLGTGQATAAAETLRQRGMTDNRVVPDTPRQTADILEEGLNAATAERRSIDNASHRHRKALYWYLFGVLISGAFLFVYSAMGPAAFGVAASYAPLADHMAVAIMLTALILACQRLAYIAINRQMIDDSVTLFNVRLVVRLVAAVLMCLVFLSAVSQTWYTLPLALGMFSIVTGFALQTPMSSFVGWIYILFSKPYRVGDRIKIGDATGDVIDVSYFDTTLWEFGGQYLSTDHPSGRIIKFPNSIVLTAPVYNYSWVLFPYLWDEIRLHVAYNADLDFISEVMLAVATEEVGAVMAERIRAYRSVLDKTPVDQLDVREEPTVFFRPSDDGWLDAVVRYLAGPKEAGRLKTVILRKMLVRLNAEPDRVLFPKFR